MSQRSEGREGTKPLRRGTGPENSLYKVPMGDRAWWSGNGSKRATAGMKQVSGEKVEQNGTRKVLGPNPHL